MHQTSADPRFLECCDRLGLLVIADMPAPYRFSPTALARTSAELTSLVQRDINHPSVIGWITYNESWGVPHLVTSPAQRHAVAALYSLVKALDPSRLALGNDGWEYIRGDFLGVHDYSQDGGTLRERYHSHEAVQATLRHLRPGGRALSLDGQSEIAAQLPVLLTEFGGLSAHTDPSAWKAYGDVLSPDQLIAGLRDLLSSMQPESGLAGYCYTQLTDTLQEKNGLLTEDREAKWPIEDIRRAVRGEHGHGQHGG